MTPFPTLVRATSPSGEARYSLDEPLVDLYLEFVTGRVRPNTLRAVAFDLKTFFNVVKKDPAAVVPADIFEFLADQRGDEVWFYVIAVCRLGRSKRHSQQAHRDNSRTTKDLA
jgi:hypothetical protein